MSTLLDSALGELGKTFTSVATTYYGSYGVVLAVLIGVYGAIHRGDLLPQSRVHVRNRFLSAFDGSPDRVRIDRAAPTLAERRRS